MTRFSTPLAALERAVQLFGSNAALASEIKVAASAPPMWKKRGNVPAEHCPSIELATAQRGDRVTCEELRPDVQWRVLRDQAAPPEPAGAEQGA